MLLHSHWVVCARGRAYIPIMSSELTMRLGHRGSPPAHHWEIYRDNNPTWVERSMQGSHSELEASRDGQAALQRLINREAAAKPNSARSGPLALTPNKSSL